MKRRESRREFLARTARTAAVASALGFAPRLTGLAHAAPAPATGPDKTSPFSFAAAPSSEKFNGDDDTHPHEILWNLDRFIQDNGGIPAVSEEVEVAVVGGGAAGLAAAYFLKDLEPVVYEQAPQYGGNAKGEIIGATRYGLGSAYLAIPQKGSVEEKLLADLGLTGAGRVEQGDEMAVQYGSNILQRFWDAQSSPGAEADFKSVLAELKRISASEFPEIPNSPGGMSTASFNKLDRTAFYTWMKERFPNLHPHVEEFFTLYCWSAFGGSIDELSAAQVLNFLASDADGVMAFPGGNAAITAAMHAQLKAELPAGRMRSLEIVVDVHHDASGVRITSYAAKEKKLKAVRAKHCVVACPKFVAKRIVSTLPKPQAEAMNRLHYRAYIVGNVILKGKVASPGFDLFRLEGKVPPYPRWGEANPRPFTDVVMAGWAANDATEQSVLSIYEPLPFDGAHQFLFNPNAHEKHKKRIEAGLEGLLTALNVSKDRVMGIRLTRWGHSIPIASYGLLASGDLAKACAPVDGRVFFANQDNWANPSIECAINTAHEAAQAIRKGR